MFYSCRALLVTGCTCIYAYNLAVALKYTTFFMTIMRIIILHEEYSSDFCILLEINMNISLVPLRPEFGLVLKSGTLCVL